MGYSKMEVVEIQMVIGIDVSKDKLDIYIQGTGEHRVIVNHPRQIGEWLTQMTQQYQGLKLVFEPTGRYEKKLILLALKHRVTCYGVHPNKIHNFKKCLGNSAKTDKIDAIIIAKYALDFPEQLKLIDDSYIEHMELRELSARRRQLKADIHRIVCQMKHDISSAEVRKSYARMKKVLLVELKTIEATMTACIHADKEKQHKVELLQSIKGVGVVTSQMMVTEVPELGQLDKRKICKLIGVAPLNCESGKKAGGRHIDAGRRDVRNVIYMAALVAIRHNEHMRRIYQQLRARGKLAKVAIVAIMRRLVCTMNAMIRDDKKWTNSNSLAAQKA